MSHTSSFSFSRDVVQVFDDMAHRSIPFYDEIIRMSAEISFYYYQKETSIWDLGSSTGNMAIALLSIFEKNPFIYYGIDNSREMVKKAREKLKKYPGNQLIHFLKGDVVEMPPRGANKIKPSIIIANFIFQFIRPEERLSTLKNIYNYLAPGGILIFSEKVLEKNSAGSRLFSQLYHEFKKKNDYSDLEISQKRDALENVLIPYRLDENTSLIKESGFQESAIFFKWYNFASILAYKKI